ncbi:MAG: hypothetical protein MUE72_04985 [Chitinophagaceae bacterium]|jgi:hypothetical protein|nr:hypothetical protein [Chitinophagaceae bacterium]
MLIALFISISFLILSTLFGQFVFKAFNFFCFKASYHNIDLLSSTLFGALLSISVLAIYYTKAISLQTIVLLLLLLSCLLSKKFKNFDYSIKKHIYGESKPDWKFILLLVCTFCLTHFIVYASIGLFDEQLAFIGHVDNHYYTYQGAKMIENRIEGSNFPSLQMNTLTNQYRIPYHYFDMWMAGCFYQFSKLSITDSYHLIFIPVSINLTIIAFIILLRQVIQKFSYLSILIAAVFAYFLSINFFNNTPTYGSLLEYYPKHFVCYIIVSLFLREILNVNTTRAFTILWVLPLLNILALPTVAAFSILFIIYLWYKKETKNWLFICIISLFTILMVSAYYLLFGEIASRIQKTPNSFYAIFYRIKTYFFSSGDGLVLIESLLIVIVVIFLLNLKNSILKQVSNRNFCFLLLSMYCLGYLLTGILKVNLDSWQIVFFPSKTIFPISVLCLLGLYIRSNRTSIFSGIVFSIIILTIAIPVFKLIYQPITSTSKNKVVSKVFINQLDSVLRNNDRGGYLYDSSFLKSKSWAYNPFTLSRSLNFISLVPKKLHNINLNTFINEDEAQKETTIPFNFLKQGEFHKFIEQNVGNKTLASYRFEFIKSRKLDYVLLDYNVMPDSLMLSISKGIIKDSYSGLSVILIKH